MSEFGRSAHALATALPDPADADNVVYNPPPDRLRSFSSHLETTTEFGAPAYVSDQQSRCADRTRNAVDDEFTPEDYRAVERAIDAARTREMVCLDRRMGRHPEHTYRCRLYVPRAYGRIALALCNLFEPVEGPGDPDLVTVQIPDGEGPVIRVLPEAGLTAVLGSDYTGEAKKAFLRLFMYDAKRQGGLGLHAGSKRVTLEHGGDLVTVGQLFLGLSATGKSTLTAHGLWLDGAESATMLQDDVCALRPDGTVAGSEGNGLYVKTIGLDPADQPALYDAVTDASAVLENVDVAPDGTVDFASDRHTTNGRAAIRRNRLRSAGEEIDLGTVDQVFFITRNPVMPPIAKLSSTEAAAAFMLGESVETSAGDPEKAGESVRVVGTNPFIIGPPGAEGNRFRALIEDLDVDCFVLNTGHLGDGAGTGSKDITVEDTVTILRELARGRVRWTEDDATGMTVPAHVPGLDIDAFAVPEHVEAHEERLAGLRAERRSYLERFEALDDAIKRAVY